MTTDKETQGKIVKVLTPYMRVGAYTQEYWARKTAGWIMDVLSESGYRKLPKDKPPLLEQKNCHEVNNPSDWNMGASEQRDADIRYYEEV